MVETWVSLMQHAHETADTQTLLILEQRGGPNSGFRKYAQDALATPWRDSRHVYVCTHVCMYILLRIYVCMYILLRIYVFTCIWIHIYSRICILIPKWAHTHQKNTLRQVIVWMFCLYARRLILRTRVQVQYWHVHGTNQPDILKFVV
jgi:hypothetical protein